MDITGQILRGFKMMFGARIIDAVANGVLMLLLARVFFTPGQYGLFFFVIAVIGTFQLVADLGLSRSSARYIAEYQESNPGRVPFLLRTSLFYKIVLIFLISILLLVGRNFLADILNTPELGLLIVPGVVYLAVQSLTSYSEILFQGFNSVPTSAIIRVANSIVRVAAVIVFAALGFGVIGALVGYIAGGLVASIIGLTLLYRKFYVTFNDEGGSQSLRNRLLKYSIPLTASHSANILDKRIDTVLVGFFLNPLAVSYYVLSKQITEFVVIPAGSLGFSVSPAYGERKANDALDHAARIYESTLEYTLLLYVPAAVGIWLVAEPGVALVFGAEYTNAAPVLQILGIYVVFQAITNVTTNGLDYLGRAKHRAIAKGVTSIGNVILTILLIPLYGVEGAAIATVVTFGIYTLVNIYIMYAELPLDLARVAQSFGLTIIVSAAMGMVIQLAIPFASNLIILFSVIVLGILIWAILAIASGLMDIDETLNALT